MTPQEIKDELIRLGWEENYKNTSDCFLSNKINENKSLYYNIKNSKLLIAIKGVGSFELIKQPTIDRIKALVYGLTREEM